MRLQAFPLIPKSHKKKKMLEKLSGARYASPFEMYSIFMEFLNSNSPLVTPILALLIVFFGIPIVGGILILLIEGRPKSVTKTDQAETDPKSKKQD
jgi:hypothetical protein